MSNDAPGQFLGYAIQLPKAVAQLLLSNSGDIVCIEYFGDVMHDKLDGTRTTIEMKSSVQSNPITDKSKDLWKTFSNWVDAVKDSSLTLDKTHFVLYSNRKGQRGIVNEFSDANSEQTARLAITGAKNRLADIDSQHEAWKYYQNAVIDNEGILIQIIVRFSLQVDNNDGSELVIRELKRMHFTDNQVDYLVKQMYGWVQRVAINKIYNKQACIISWDGFHSEFLTMLERIRCLELIDYTRDTLDSEQIENTIKRQPKYIRQLLDISCNPSELIVAVSDYMKAHANRTKWIENGIIDIDAAKEFQEKLHRYWENRKKGVKLGYPHLSEEEKGQMLLSECMARSEMIRNQTPPSSTVPGTYHELADEPVLGWHPNWDENIKKYGEE